MTLPELIAIVDMARFKRHQDHDLLVRVVTGDSLGEYQSMTDLEGLGGSSGSSADFDLDSEFTITHLPIGLGYESNDVG